MSDPDPQVHALTLRRAALSAWLDDGGGLERALSENLVVAFLGSASSGKDSGIKALFGLDFGEVSPIPGSTDRVRVARLDEAGKVLLVNAPGFGDVRQGVDDKAREVMGAVDVVVYVVNCEGGATADERNDLDEIRKLGRPVLVCLNKIDLIRARDRDTFVSATLAQLGVDPDRDWHSGVLREVRQEDAAAAQASDGPWYESLWVARATGAILFLAAIAAGVVKFVL